MTGQPRAGGRPRLEVGRHGNIKVTETPAGRWLARAYLRDSRGKRRRVSVVADNAADAEHELRRKIADEARRVEGTDITPDTVFRIVAAAYLDDVTRDEDKAATTHDRYSHLLARHVLPELGELPIRKVTARRLQELFNSLRDRGLGVSTVKGVRTVVSGSMKVAVEAQAAESTRLASVRLKRGQLTYSEVSLSEGEAVQLLEVARGDDRVGELELYDFLVVMLCTGARVSEVLGLRWRDVHLGFRITDCYFSFRKNAVFVKGAGVVLQDGKSKAAKRDVDMNPDTAEVMLRRAGYEGNHPDFPVFPSANGRHRDPSSMRKLLKPVYDQVPAFEKVTQPTHIYRKTVATQMDELNTPAREIADKLGHASIAMTQSVYMRRRGRRAETGTSALDFVRERGQLEE